MRSAISFALALLCVSTSGYAAVNFFDSPKIVLAVSPPEPDTRSAITVSLDSSACLLVTLLPVQREDRDIYVRVRFSDFCDPALAPYFKSEPIGMLPAGDYVVHYLACADNALPPGTCFEDARESFSVVGARRQAIPTLGKAATALLALLLLVAARIARH